MMMVGDSTLGLRDLWCPRCTSQSLGAKAANESTERNCPKCGGTYLGTVGLERLARAYLSLTLKQLHGLQTFVPKTPLACPNCRTGMSLLTLRSVPLDYCADCASLWFDGGELYRLTAGKQGRPNPAPTRQVDPDEPLPDNWDLSPWFRVMGWFLPSYSIWTEGRSLVAGNSMLARLLTLFLYMRWSIIDRTRLEVRIVTRWFWLFRSTNRLRFTDVKELTTGCSRLWFDDQDFCGTEQTLQYEVSLTTRDGKICRLASFVGTTDDSPLPTDRWLDFLQIHRNYYAYYDRAVWLMGYASGDLALTRVSGP